MGFHRNMPQCIIFCAKSHGRSSISTSPPWDGSTANHNPATSSLHQYTTWTGPTLLICTYQLWADLSESILIKTQPCPWVPNCWLSWIHRTLNKYQIQLQYDAWTIPPIQTHNTHILEAIMQLNLTLLQKHTGGNYWPHQYDTLTASDQLHQKQDTSRTAGYQPIAVRLADCPSPIAPVLEALDWNHPESFHRRQQWCQTQFTTWTLEC